MDYRIYGQISYRKALLREQHYFGAPEFDCESVWIIAVTVFDISDFVIIFLL